MIRRRLRLCSAATAALLISIANLYAEDELISGVSVFAEWSANSWYHGKVDSACDGGFMILFDDGDTKCCKLGRGK